MLDDILRAFLASGDFGRDGIAMLADAVEEHLSADLAFKLRGATDAVVEPRGRGWFVGFSFPSDRGVKGLLGEEYEQLTHRLASLACEMGGRRATA